MKPLGAMPSSLSAPALGTAPQPDASPRLTRQAAAAG